MQKSLLPAPRYQDLVCTLETYNLLPVIIFISSRRGCDEATDSIRGNALADLTETQREAILNIIKQFSPEDQQFVSEHRFFHTLIYKGVAPHHAGHLPAWKHAVEKLMSKGLLRAVFSTTTLAAGIDMPARSVVITASSLRDDEGHRDIKAFELAQMTGRAGRRGKDKVGFAVFIPGPFQDISLIMDVLVKDPEPITSQFSPNYTMVLNLLQQHSPETARELLERSFGHYQRLKTVSDLNSRLKKVEDKINKDKSSRPCSDRIKTWQEFDLLEEQTQKLRKSIKILKRNIKHELAAEIETDTPALLAKAENKLSQILPQLESLPCLMCPQINICDERVGVLQEQTQRAEELKYRLHDLEHGLWERFEECARLLQTFEYLNVDWQPTKDGIWAAKLHVENSLFLAELVKTNYFKTNNPRLLAALVGALSAGDRQIEVEYQEGEEDIFLPFKNAVKLAKTISQLQDRVGLYFPIILDGDAGRLLWRWAEGKIDWQELFEEVYADEGDIVRLILRTSDLLSQLTSLTATFPELSETAYQAINLIRRPPVED